MPALPLPIAEVYEELKNEVVWLHARWNCYRELFGHSDRRIELLNESASSFFFIIQDVLLDEVQVALSKLTDPAKSGKLENLSLEQLQTRLELHGDPALALKDRGILDALHVQCTLFRERRNKKLAHFDLTTSLNLAAVPLPGVSRQMIEEALKSVRDYLNAIEAHYNDSEIGYEHFLTSSGAEALVATLKAGLRYEELVQANAISWDDWRRGAWHDA